MTARGLGIFISLVFLGSGVCLADSGVRALSMGGAFVGLADDGEAVYWNPAALGLLDRPELSCYYLLHNQNEAGNDISCSFVYPMHCFQDMDWGVVGLSFIDDSEKGIVDYNSTISLDSKLTRRKYLLSYGRKILRQNLALGVNLHYATYDSELNKQVAITGITYPNGSSDSDSYFAFDLAGFLKLNKLSIGVLLKNVNEPKINLYGTDINYDLKIMPGATYSIDEKTKYSIAVDDFFDTNQIRIGGERWVMPYLALRLGTYNLNKKENRAITFGCGLNSTEIFAYTDIEIDYALLYWTNNPAGEDDFSHLLGLKMKF